MRLLSSVLAAAPLFLSTTTLAFGSDNTQQTTRNLAGNNNNNSNNKNQPKEKDVDPQICTTQALLDADISNNQFISRAEYVNLLLDLAPSDCRIIDSWLNDEPLQETFEALSCLCHEYGGVDGENNCCLQAVNMPLLASFAVPNSYYSDGYNVEACTLIDKVLYSECPTISVMATEAPTYSPTLEPTIQEPTTQEPTLEPTTEEPTLYPSTLEPTVTETSEQTHAGENVLVIIEDGDVTVEEGENIQEQQDWDDTEEAFLEKEEEEEEMQHDLILEEEDQELQEEDIMKEEEEEELEEEGGSVLVIIEPPTVSPTAPPIALAGGQDASNEGVSLVEGSTATTTTEEPPPRETPLGIILAALLVVIFILTLALLAAWGRRRRLWKRETNPPTVSSEDNVTPTRSNRRNHSFSSDEGSTDEDDDDDDHDIDIERPRTLRRSSSGGSALGVVRAEFQDDLSVWGRRKRRRQDRKQRREERRRASLEHHHTQHRSSISSILKTLEYDLTNNPSTGATANGVEKGSVHPSSTRSLVSCPTTPKEDHNIDIFDDTSETSSYDGSPRPNDPLPMETSIEIENWLQQVQSSGGANNPSQIMDDHSMGSRMSRASSLSRTSNSPHKPKLPHVIKRQPKDPLSQDWVNQRKQKQQGPFALDYSKFRATNAPALSPSRSFSPSRPSKTELAIAAIVNSASFSPSRGYTTCIRSSPPASPPASQSFTILASSASFSPSRQEQQHSQSVPASPTLLALQQPSLSEVARPRSESSVPQKRVNRDDASPPADNPLHLDLPVEHTHHRPPARLSPDSQEFYDSVLRLEPSEDEEDDRKRGNAFAFETARQAERYLV